MDRVQQEQNDTVQLRKRIKRLEEQVKLDKTIRKIIDVFIDHVMAVYESKENVKRYLYATPFNLHEHTLQLSIFVKNNLHRRETQDKNLLALY